MNTRFRSFLNDSNFFYSYQYGFREGGGTEIALTEITNMIYNALDQQKYVGALFLDLKKAFDTVDHQLLLSKLHCYGFRGVTYNLIESYLSNRQQYVALDGLNSNILNINCGVPQGSVLGPLLFLVFINDIAYLPLIGAIRIFADDTAIFYETKDPSTLADSINHDLKILLEYFQSNLISLNLSKTNYIVFQSPLKRIFDSTSIYINNIEVKRVDFFKYLGVIFDSHMTWSEHINHVCSKLAPLVGLVRKLSYFLPKYVLRLMYFAFIHSRITYGLIVYGTACYTKLKKIQVMQNRAVKGILMLPMRFPSLQLYKSETNGILPIRALFDFQVALYMYKVLNNSIMSHLEFLNYNHNYETRFGYYLNCGYIKNEFGRKSIRFSGPTIYNLLPQSLKNSINLYQFKKSLKIFYQSCINKYIS